MCNYQFGTFGVTNLMCMIFLNPTASRFARRSLRAGRRGDQPAGFFVIKYPHAYLIDRR